jgi:hypothetical protein
MRAWSLVFPTACRADAPATAESGESNGRSPETAPEYSSPHESFKHSDTQLARRRLDSQHGHIDQQISEGHDVHPQTAVAEVLHLDRGTVRSPTTGGCRHHGWVHRAVRRPRPGGREPVPTYPGRRRSRFSPIGGSAHRRDGGQPTAVRRPTEGHPREPDPRLRRTRPPRRRRRRSWPRSSASSQV